MRRFDAAFGAFAGRQAEAHGEEAVAPQRVVAHGVAGVAREVIEPPRLDDARLDGVFVPREFQDEPRRVGVTRAERDHDPIDRQADLVHRDGQPPAGVGSLQKADHVALEKRGDVVLQPVTLPIDAAGAPGRHGDSPRVQPAEAGEEPWDRA